MAKQPIFRDGGVYHVYNRGVEKRNMVEDDKDRARFVHELFICNSHDSAENVRWAFAVDPGYEKSGARRSRKRDTLVDILAWVLMPNHYHLVLRQREGGSVPKFMQKFGTGYTLYFNVRYERSGVLFQGRYKAKYVDEQRYLNHLISYVHLNPVDIFFPGWKEDGLKSPVLAANELEGYRWSSYLDYIGRRNFPSLINRKQAEEIGIDFGKSHHDKIREWLRSSKEFSAENFDFK